MSTTATPSARTLLWRAMQLRCPVCGQRRIFRRWFHMLERCPRCAFRFERRPGHFVGAVGMNTIVVFGAGLIALVTGFILTAPDIAVVPLVAVGLAIALVGPVLFYPFSKTAWAAIDLIFTPLDEEEAPGRR